MTRILSTTAVLAMTLLPVTAVSAQDGGPGVGEEFPPDFPEIIDHSLDVPVIGFGSSGEVTRPPVIFLHGNNDTPYPTECNGSFGKIQEFARYFLAHGYAPSELWALGYQGDQCDLLTDPEQRSGPAHSTVANVPDLRRFVDAVQDYTGANQVDIVGHSLGTTLAREWMRQDDAYGRVRRLVGVDGPNHGILNCSPNPRNYWQQPALGGFDPDSAICREYGAGDTPFLTELNREPAPPPTEYLMIRNGDVSFVYVSEQDGTVPPVPAENRRGEPEDFSDSAALSGADDVVLTEQGRHDDALQSAHLGIVNSPETWARALAFLTTRQPDADPGVDDTAPDGSPGPSPAPAEGAETSTLPATGGGPPVPAVAALLLGFLLLDRRRRLGAQT